MKRKLISILLALGLVGSLAGCQLAREDAQAANADCLVGVYITTQYLNLFDAEAYMKDHWNDQKSEATEARAYQGRLYGVNVSDDPMNPVYEFPGPEGVALWCVPVEAETGEFFWTTSSTPEASFHTEYKVADDLDSTIITADLYVDCNQGTHAFYANPIYRTADGEIYLLSGTGLSGDMSQPGTSMNTNLAEETAVTLGGETSRRRIEIDLTFHPVEPVTEVVLLRMDDQDRVLTRETFPADAIPASYAPTEDTAYLIAVSLRGENCEPERTVYDRDDETMLFCADRSNGYLLQKTTTIPW